MPPIRQLGHAMPPRQQPHPNPPQAAARPHYPPAPARIRYLPPRQEFVPLVPRQQQHRHAYLCSVGQVHYFNTQQERALFLILQNQRRALSGLEELDPELGTYIDEDPRKYQITREQVHPIPGLRRENFAPNILPWGFAGPIPGYGCDDDTVYFQWLGHPHGAYVLRDMTCYDVCRHRPNSLFGHGLDPFIQLNFTASTMIQNLPDNVRQWLQENPKREGWLAKRLNVRRRELMRENLLDGISSMAWNIQPFREIGQPRAPDNVAGTN